MTDLMLIVPHPDDEVFSCGGLFSKMSDAGKRVATLTLTRGGSGRTLDVCTREQLKDVREAELRASLATLGVSDVHIFDYPDYVPSADRGMAAHRGLEALDPEELIARIVALLNSLKPQTIITFPPNGSNGHPDHVMTHKLVMAALERADHRIKALYYFAAERPYGGEPREGFLAAADIARTHLPPTHYLEVGAHIENKLRAMGQHETQARSVMMFMQKYPRRLLVESFHRAYPDYPAGDGPRTVAWL